MEDFNWQEPFGNPLLDWAITGGLIILSVLVAKAIYKVFSGILKRFSAKTKSTFDDLLIDLLEEPAALTLGWFGIWKSVHYLQMNERVDSFVDKVYYFVLIGFIAWALTRLVEAIITTYLQPIVEKSESDLDDQLLPLLRKGLKIVIWTLAAIIALSNAGYDVGAIIAGLGIGGLAVALAAQDTVKNFIGGFTVFVDKPFTVKQRVVVNGVDGTVEEIGIRSTRIRTLDGRIVTVPNSKFLDSSIENISSEPSRKIVLNLGLTYSTSAAEMQEAMDLLKAIVSAQEGTDEKVLVGFNAFNDSSLNIILIYYITAGADILGVQTGINLEILKQFNERGFDFAFPTQTLHIEGVENVK